MAEIVVTCEHAGNRIPAAYAAYFRGARSVLAGHRGFDSGALIIAKRLSHTLNAPLFFSTVSRLLVDLNRSGHHRELFSEFIRNLDATEKQRIIERYYEPYRSSVEDRIARAIQRGRQVVHLSVHSFTPALDGSIRNADVGILYDPPRSDESCFAFSFQKTLKRLDPDLKVRRNYPYRGNADGFTTYLREVFDPDCYSGIEIEVNQRKLRFQTEILQMAKILEHAVRATKDALLKQTA